MSQNPTPPTTGRILIVDDEPTNLNLLRQTLEPQGYETLVATDGAAALDVARDAIPDLILLDVIMAGLDGFETCRRLKGDQTTQDIPVIFITAKTEPNEIIQGFHMGGIDYITKPFYREEVLARVQTHLRTSQLTKMLLETSTELASANQELMAKNRALEQEVARLKAITNQLVQSEKMAALGRLVAGVAHEMNNPVGVVNSATDVSTRCVDRIINALGASDGLNNLMKNKQFQQAIKLLQTSHQTIITASHRIKEIVDSLKNFRRLDEAEFQKTDIHECIESTLTLLKNRLDQISVHKAFGKIPKILCYPARLNQVFMHLLQNAADAIEGKGEVWIKTSQAGNLVRISVRDNGKGIPQDALPKIFDPFFKLTPVGHGRGLGLATSYHIIDQHGGEIQVESEAEKGTQFVVTLPIVP